MKSALLSLIVTLPALAVSPAAQAAPPPASHRIEINAGDLADPARLAALRAEIRAAARDTCRRSLRGDLLRAHLLGACIDASAGNALARLDALTGDTRASAGATARQRLAEREQ